MSLTKIKSVDAHSPAQRAGVRPGETLTHINGRPIVDVLDYKFFAYDPRLELTLVGGDGRSRTLRVRKAEGEELGLNFETYLMDKARSCANRCIFCFVDQMPPGMRETLYFKDDDARLSFLMGNYITLTNLSEREIARIAELRISPINISVHATDPALREAMLKHRRAGECLAIMERFAAAGITMNCQIVACPGVNDGPALDRTLRELGALHPAVGSVAVVPVGVTRFREETLYFKDDDARLSFLMGNYITLTNLSEREIARIAELRISPINISVHATDPALREAMLKHRRAGECLAIMERFAAAGITMNCQIVACPGVNDGPALDRTLRELGALHPAVGSVAVVPVGVTRFREGLYRIDPYTPAQAAAVLDQVEAFAASFLKKHSTHLAWCSDEFYLLAGRPLPEKGYYEDMAQMENGVGMLRLLISQAAMALEDMELEEAPPPFAIATGVSAAPFLQKIVDMCREKCGNIIGNVYPVVNRFFGETITVSGLITGRDLIEQLKGRALGERLLIPDSMLRAGERIFLDDVTVEQVEEALGVPVTALPADSGFDLVDAILGLPVEAPAYALPPEDDYYRYNP